MKKIKIIATFVFVFFVSMINVKAIPVGSSNLDYSSCYAFSDVFKTITTAEGSYYYKYCYRATCSAGVYQKANMVANSAYRCQNGNGTPYTKVSSDGCRSYSGSCNTKNTTYCTKVLLVDCNKSADGSNYGKPTTTTKKTTTKRTTTKKTTTRRTTTTKRITTTSKKTQTGGVPTTTKRPGTIETPTTDNRGNTNIKKITINGNDAKYVEGKTVYTLQLPEGLESVDVVVELEDERTKYTVEGNNDIPNTEHDIIVKVTAMDGTEKAITYNVVRYTSESDDCTLANIYMENYALDFSKNNYDYKLSLPKNVTSLDLEVVPSDEVFATYEIKGNEKLRNNSKVQIFVTAQNKKECVYTIKIKKGSDTWKYVVLIILLVGALGTSVYFLFKYLKKSKGKYKYE